MVNEYCEKGPVKDRVLINPSDTSYDDALDVAIEEASRLVDIFLKPYVDTIPLEDWNDQISAITADFSASIFKRRMLPDEVKIPGSLQPDQMNEINAQGWFGQGIRKIEMYIKSYYTLAVAVIGNIVHNPDIYISLFEKGIITGKEARNFISTDFAIANKRIDDVTKTLTETDTITKTLTTHETHDKYITKKQKSFAFVEGNPDDEGYKEQEE
jgi:hypothetical protein